MTQPDAWCPQCGAQRAEGHRYCSKCRFDFTAITSTPTPPATEPRASRRGVSASTIALSAVAGVLMIAILALVYANFIAPAATTTADRSATPSARGEGDVIDADGAVCEAAAIFNEVQQGPVLRFAQFVGDDDDVFPDEETRPMLIEIGESSLEAAELLTDLRYPKNPLVVQHLRDAFVGYGDGAANLVTALDLPRAEYQDQWLAGLQQITDGRDALDAANSEIERMEIAGELDC